MRSLRTFSTIGFLLLVGVVVLTGCGKPFNVQPKPAMPPGSAAASYKASAEVAGVTIQAEAITDEDYLYDTFEANLIMAGILPVRARVTNASADSARLKDAKFEIHPAGSRPFKLISAGKAYGKLMDYYAISVYNKRGYAQSKEDFLAYAMDVKKNLDAGERREGLLFFAIPTEIIRKGGLRLVTRELKVGNVKHKTPVELILN